MALIDSLPNEILSEIFSTVPTTWTVVHVSHVCRRWHDVAHATPRLWNVISLRTSDIEHVDIVAAVFERSKRRPIDLELVFYEPPADYENYRRFVREVVAWETLIEVCKGETFPRLRVLDITSWPTHAENSMEEYFTPATVNMHTAPITTITTNAAHPLPAHPPHPAQLPLDLIFPLPSDHRLESVHLSGIALPPLRFPLLCEANIVGYLPGIVGSEDRLLNPWLLRSADIVTFQDMFVPVMNYPEDATPTPSRVCGLVLSRLRATPTEDPDDDAEDEYSCTPFFCSLKMTFLLYLEIDRLDLTGRVWDDFLEALFMDPGRYPLLRQLKVRGMHFAGHGLQVDNGFVLRDDPFPFRGDVFAEF
ncbi:hypothetical protein C8J57DRAFT_1223164 [Mycena rebaudengoi]|nr:hypothetical protein C8J57DRAFT_1223164 [Mycena rebaudengoi]